MLLGPRFEVSKDWPYSQCVLFSASCCGSKSELSAVHDAMLCLCSIIMDSNPLTPLAPLNSFLSRLGHGVLYSNRKETNTERPHGLYLSVYHCCQPKF